jgi:hypothetical protein
MLKSNTNSHRFMTAFSNKYYMTKINFENFSSIKSGLVMSKGVSSALSIGDVTNAEEAAVGLISVNGKIINLCLFIFLNLF